MSSFLSKQRCDLDDRRQLIKHLIENYQKRGGRVLYPEPIEENILFDSINVTSLINALKTEQLVNLKNLASYEERGISSRFRQEADRNTEGSQQCQLTLGQGPSLELELDLNDHELQQFAFLLFCVYGVDKEDTKFANILRRQLELSSANANDILKIAHKIKSKINEIPPNSTTFIGVKFLILLLQQTRPDDFRKFREFVNWRDSIARVLTAVLKASILQTPTTSTPSSSYQIASLKGSMRRLCFQEEEDFHEDEYAATINQLVQISESSTLAFPWGLRIRIWEVLLNSLFESYEEDVYIDEEKDMMKIFQQKLAPKLQVSLSLHEACSAWVHFKQLCVSLYPGLIPVLKSVLSKLDVDDIQGNKVDEKDQFYISEVARVCFLTLTETLMDYHEKLRNPELMSGIVELFLILSKSRIVDKVDLEDCIESSCRKAFQRVQNQATQTAAAMPSDSNSALRLKILADLTQELHEDELLKYTGSLALFCPSSAAIAAKTFHICYGEELNPVLYELKTIPNEVVNMLKSADLLEGALMREISQDKIVSKSVSPWNVMEAISDVLSSWVDAQLRRIRDWQERLIEKETWQPQSDHAPLAASALELKRLLEESVTLVLSMDLYFPENLVENFVSGISRFIQSYAEATLRDIDGEKGTQLLVPPVPSPTRYKKDLADSAAQKEIRADTGKPTKKHSRFKSIMKDPDIVKTVPLIEDSDYYPWFNNLKMNTLIVRINSLYFLKQSIPDLREMIKESFGFDSGSSEQNDRDLLAQASIQLEKALSEFCKFFGLKLVFWDNRLPWLEQLYRHRVQSSRIDFIIEEIHKSLLDISILALDDIRNRIVTSVLDACVDGLRRVLLDGGPYRLFRNEQDDNDRELIEQDLKRLKELFNDNNDGLPMDVVEEKTKPLLEILLKMSLSTNDLIKLAEDTKKNGPADHEVFTKILGHRADRLASKWLKKTLKWSKKMKPNA
eukprot:g7826.t1